MIRTIGRSKYRSFYPSLSARVFSSTTAPPLPPPPPTSSPSQSPAPSKNTISSSSSTTLRGIKRFWNDVEADGNSKDGYIVKLDGRTMKTPNGNILKCKSKILTLLVASEWNNIVKDTPLSPNSLLITSIVARSIDDFPSVPSGEVEEDKLDGYDNDFLGGRQAVMEELGKYLDTDTICCLSEHPATLVEMQKKEWDPIVQWAQRHFSVPLNTTSCLFSAQQPAETKQRLMKYVNENYDNLMFAGFEKAVLSSKSFLIALALFERAIDVETAARAARLEHIVQSKIWGYVEDTHDVDDADMQRQLGAAATVLFSNSSSSNSSSGNNKNPVTSRKQVEST